MLKAISANWRSVLLGTFVFLTVLTFWPLTQSPTANARTLATPRPAPEFTGARAEDWVNSAPLTWADLKGSVVLMDIWAFECWNCYRSFPWLNDLEARYQDKGLKVIGIHTPEFEREKDRDAVIAKTKEFGLKHPTMLDNDFVYWTALRNRYWPTYYLVDKKGNIRSFFIGETHKGDARAKAIEAEVQKLLAEEA